MHRRVLVLFSFVAAPCILGALAAACFPDYEIAEGPLPGADGGAPLDSDSDGASPPGDGNGMAPADGNVPPRDAPPRDGNAPPPQDGGPPPPPADAAVPPVLQQLVPAGSFAYRNPSDTSTTAATLSHAFYLDQTELTVGVLRAWVAAQKPVPCVAGDAGAKPCTLDPGGPYEQTIQWDPRWNTFASDELYKDSNGNCSGLSQPFDTAAGTYQYPDDRLPATCINWYIAASLCWFAGQKRLPTQVEWQYEATGRGAGRTYPWGDTPVPSDCTLAVWNDGNTQSYDGCNFPLDVGSNDGGGASIDGVWDMAGSVHEWTWDWYDSTYPNAWPTDYAGLPGDAGNLQKPVRGGGWASDVDDLPALHLYIVDNGPNGSGTYAYDDVGVRCAKTKL
jgi:formylglycine-generating enzyme required for sulfatase activity